MKLKLLNPINFFAPFLLGTFLFFTLASCSKEDKTEKKITGTWKITSYKENGVELLNVWKEDPQQFTCTGGKKITCSNKIKLTSEIWTINENGTIQMYQDLINLGLDYFKIGGSNCSCVYLPENPYDLDFDFNWELSSNQKIFTTIYSGTRYPYEVLEFTNKTLRIKRQIDSKTYEWNMESY